MWIHNLAIYTIWKILVSKKKEVGNKILHMSHTIWVRYLHVKICMLRFVTGNVIWSLLAKSYYFDLVDEQHDFWIKTGTAFIGMHSYEFETIQYAGCTHN